MEKDRRTTVALAFAQHVMLAFMKEEENEAMKKLRRDMQVEAFVIWYPDRAPFDMPATFPTQHRMRSIPSRPRSTDARSRNRPSG
jgi:hypothetical protein